MIFPGFPGVLSFFQVFQVFQVEWEPWLSGFWIKLTCLRVFLFEPNLVIAYKTGQKLRIHEDVLHNNFNFNEIIMVWDDFYVVFTCSNILIIQETIWKMSGFKRIHCFDILNLQSKLFHDTSGTQLWRWSSIVFSSDVIHEQNIRYGGDICFCDVATRVAKSLTGAWKFGLLMQFKQM